MYVLGGTRYRKYCTGYRVHKVPGVPGYTVQYGTVGVLYNNYCSATVPVPVTGFHFCKLILLPVR